MVGWVPQKTFVSWLQELPTGPQVEEEVRQSVGLKDVDTPATPDSPLFSFSESLKTKNAVGTGPCCVSCRSSMVHARTVEKGGQSHSREDRLSHGLGCRGQGQSISVISAPHPVLDHS